MEHWWHGNLFDIYKEVNHKYTWALFEIYIVNEKF